MPTNLQGFRAAVEAVWAGVAAPADGSGLAYRFIDDLNEERGGGRHRELIWRLAETSTTVAEHDEQREWICSAELFIHRRPDATHRAFVAAAEDEATTLALAFNGLDSQALGAGVIEAELTEYTFEGKAPDRGDRAGGVPRLAVVVVTFNFTVLCEER